MKPWPWLVIGVVVALCLWGWLAHEEPSGVAVPEVSESPQQEPESGHPTLISLPPREDAAPRPATPPPAIHPTPVADRAPEATSYTIHGTAIFNGTDEVVTRGSVVAWINVLERVGGGLRMGRKAWKGDIDDEGRFSIRVTGTPAPEVGSFDYQGGSLRIEGWSHADDGSTRGIDAAHGATNTIRVLLGAVFRLRGEVVDSEGRLLEGVRTEHGVPQVFGGELRLAGERGTTEADGAFDVGPFAVKPHAKVLPLISLLHVTFRSEGCRVVQLDPWTVPEGERDHVRVVMDAGATLAGTLVDSAGQPLARVVVDAEYGTQYQLRRATRTDENGRWQLDRLQRGKAVLRARAFAFGAKARREIEIDDDDLDVKLVAQAVLRPPPESVKNVLGLSLVDVNEELRAAYELPKEVSILILAVEEGHARLGIGSLEPGFGLRVIGDTAVASIREAVTRLLALGEKIAHQPPGAFSPGVRIVYTYATENGRGSNTQHARLTSEDLVALKRLANELEGQ